MPRFPQVDAQHRRRASRPPARRFSTRSDRLNAELGASGRVLVRPSGTEPVVRVLAEAENAADAEKLCASIAALVERELG